MKRRAAARPRPIVHAYTVALDPPGTTPRRWGCVDCGRSGATLAALTRQPCKRLEGPEPAWRRALREKQR